MIVDTNSIVILNTFILFFLQNQCCQFFWYMPWFPYFEKRMFLVCKYLLFKQRLLFEGPIIQSIVEGAVKC